MNIYAVVTNAKTEELIKVAGTKNVVSTRILGRTITSALFEPAVLTILSDIVSARGKGDLIQIKITEKHHGKTIKEIEEELNKDKKHSCRAIALVKTNNEYIIAPEPETKVAKNETLVAIKGKRETHLHLQE